MAIYVTAVFTAKSGQGDSLNAALQPLIPEVRKEDGCVLYDLHRNTSTPDKFLFYEIWANQEALKKHSESANMKKLIASIENLIVDAGLIETWNVVSK